MRPTHPPLPKAPTPAGGGKGRMDSDVWNRAEPREGPWKITGAGESGSSSPSGWGSVLPGTEGTEQMHI